MIKLIVGLGNPGREYEKTRHNAGFLFLDHVLEKYSGCWTNESKFHGIVANTFIDGNKVILLKPQTFMNRSGLSVGSVVRFYKFDVEEVLIAHDELDFEAGKVKLKKGGGHAGHNGLRDIIAALGNKDFCRIRSGIGRSKAGKSVSDYVLSGPGKEEKALILSAFNSIELQLDKIVKGDIAVAMNNLNLGTRRE